MTHYDTLEISRQASPEVVRAAYRSLIQRFHPDRRPGDAQAAERAAAITVAYEVLADPARRAAYDEELEAARSGAAQAGAHEGSAAGTVARARVHAASHPPGPVGGAPTRWLWGAMAVAVVLGAVWLAAPKTDPQGELASIRLAFAGGGLPEARLRELHARKQALLQQFPDLRVQVFAEEAQNRESRTVDLLASPLVLQMGPGELTIPRLRVVLGTFDTAAARASIAPQTERLVSEVARSLERSDAAQIQGPTGETYLKAVVLGTLANELATQPQQGYPSSYFESPGRHGVVEVLLPARFELQPR
jgi:curved DNA-binding protein CbpA